MGKYAAPDAMAKTLSLRDIRRKRQLEKLLRKHRYTQDTRPDHREWMKYNPAFHVEIRLDKDNPKGWNGFQLRFTTYLRWPISSEDMETLLGFLKEEFS